MSHTYASLLFHCIFSTKERRPWLPEPVQERLWPFIGGIAREKGFRAIKVGGIEDHIHMLVSLPTTMGVAKAIQLVKAGSSKWLSETFSGMADFAWQEGYGAFTIGVSQKPATVKYIETQKEHHRKKTFQEEYLEFLHAHGIEYDEKYIWR